jgi:hypothetical protein
MTDIAKIAALLAKAHRDAICPNDSGWAECHKGKAWSLNGLTAARLHRMGLTETSASLVRLTPLGLAVRDYLKENNHE